MKISASGRDEIVAAWHKSPLVVTENGTGLEPADSTQLNGDSVSTCTERQDSGAANGLQTACSNCRMRASFDSNLPAIIQGWEKLSLKIRDMIHRLACG